MCEVELKIGHVCLSVMSVMKYRHYNTFVRGIKDSKEQTVVHLTEASVVLSLLFSATS